VGVFYRAVRGFLRVGLRAYFREIEVHGREHLDARGPRVVIANHHNSMLDPFLLIVAADRPLSFIAKAPLFRQPVLGWALRGLGCIPAHRSQDPGYAKEKNQELYEKAGAHLARGLALAIFPEGKSHSDPHLAEFKHGASRIAFEAETCGGGVAVQLVGLHFEETRGFRGKVLVQFGPAVTLEAWRERYARDPREATAALTDELHAKLSEMILSTETHEGLRLADLVSRMRRLDDPDLKEVFDRKKEILESWKKLPPAEAEAIRTAVRRYQETLDLLGVRDEHVAQDYRPGRVLGFALRNALLLALSLPVVAAALVLDFPPYLVSWIAARIAGRLPDRRATGGFLAACLAFPAWWGFLAWQAHARGGAGAAAAVLTAAPATGAVALASLDRWHRVFRETGALWTALALPAARAKLRRLRTSIVKRLDKVAS